MLTSNDKKIISLNYLFAFISIIYIVCSEIMLNYFEIDANIFRYSDEVVTLISILLVSISSIKNKIKINKDDIYILRLLMGILIIGVVSNIIYKVQPSNVAIFLDMYTFLKIFLVYVSFKIILTKENCKLILKRLELPAKIYLIMATVCGIISLFIDIGMSGSIRFGIPSYHFIFKYEHVLATYTLVSFLIIMYNNSKFKPLYIVLIIICEVLTTKGPSLIIAFGIIFFIKYFGKNNKISIRLIIFILLSCIFLGTYQIKNYLSNQYAPRYLFLKYGCITAKNYFPLGSGFATFGSDMAAKHYSNLYVKYGFNALYGMSKFDTSFLNDTYWPMIMAQFGFIGLLITLCVFFKIYKQIIKETSEGSKSAMFVLFLYLLIHSIGSAILTSSVGVLAFIFLAIVIKAEEEKKNEED